MNISNHSPSGPRTIAEILQTRADARPDELAFCFLINGEEEGPRLTHAALDRAARAIAATLRDIAEPGERAILLYEAGLEFIPAFFGCLYAAIVPVPLAPPRAGRVTQSWQVLASVIADCQARLVLATGDLAASLAKGFENFPGGDQVRWLATDQIDGSHARRWREPGIKEDTLALLQYTSGSTAMPKGVMVSHRNLMHNESMIKTAVAHDGPLFGVTWLPLHHDMGLIGGVLQRMFYGDMPMFLMSPLGMLQKPVRWLQAMSRYRANTTLAPNFAYDLCVDRIRPEEKAALDLSHWSVAFIGSEPISARTMERFSEAFAPCGFRAETFYPCYGLAEATLLVTGGSEGDRPFVRTVSVEALAQGEVVAERADAPDARRLVGCGRPWLDQRVVIVHPETRVRLPPGKVGEIWVAGASVAQGYWNRPDETERTFRACFSDTGEGPWLRTGDLGFLEDDQLFITGRIKDVIVIRGGNYYPQDIEATVQAVHPGLRLNCGAAFETGPDGQPRLIVVQELARRCGDVDLTKLRGEIRKAVADRHGLHVDDIHFLEPGSVLKTSSGKIQRHACRAGYERGVLRAWRGT